MSLIKDGTGRSYLAKVNDKNKLVVKSTMETDAEHASRQGYAYNINTGTISLTSAGESGLLYIKNDDEYDYVITTLIYLLGTNTGGSGDHDVTVYRNPTGGTLISGGTSFSAVNRNFGSSNDLTATILKGDEGSTISGGSTVIESIFSSVGRQIVGDLALVIPKTKSIAVSVTPAASTSAMDVQIAASIYVDRFSDD